MPTAFDRAIAEWTRVLGEAHVVADEESRRRFEAATFLTHARVPAILRPAGRDEVRACLRIATAHRIAVYPISRGKNWGYGSACPPSDAVVLDLSRMDAIVDFDETLAYVTVQPGVTQRQLLQFLRERKADLWIDSVTSSPEASVLGNAIERGHGLTPYADHVAFLTNLEVALANGDVFRTGHGQFPTSRVSGIDRWGAGPSLDGLFSQSNFGVVTEATVWLMPAPEHVLAAFVSIPDDARLSRTIDALRPFRLDGTLRSPFQVWNGYRSLQRAAKYPWDKTEGKTPLTPELAKAELATLGIPPWTAAIAMYGTRAAVGDQQKRIAEALAPLASQISYVDGDTVASEPSRGRQLVFSYMTGGEDSMGFGTLRAYWRKKGVVPAGADLDRDRCGFIWCTALCPLRGEDALALSRTAHEVVLRHGFEPDVAMVCLRERTLYAHVSIVYDRDVEGDDERALLCQDELTRSFLRDGFAPPRLGLQSMSLLAEREPTYARVLATLKEAFDPHGILSPGRYEGRVASNGS